MATNPPPPRPAPGSAGAQLISLFESLPNLIGQVRAGKLNQQTVIQLRLIIPKHRKQAAEYLVRKGLPDPFIDLPDTLDPDKPLPASWSKVVEEVNKNMGITRQGNGTRPPGPPGPPGGPGPAPGAAGGVGGAGAGGGSGSVGGPPSASGGSSNTGAGGSNGVATGSGPRPPNPPPPAPSNQAASMAARPGASTAPPQVSSLPIGAVRPLPMNVPAGSPATVRPRPQPRPQAQTPRPPQQNPVRPPQQSQPRPPGQMQGRPPPQTQIRPPGPNQQLQQGVNQPRPPQGMPPQQMAGGAKAPVNRSRTTSEAPSQGGGKKPNTIAPGNKYTWAEVFKFSDEERNVWFAEEPKARPAWDNIMAVVQRTRQKEAALASRSASPAPDPAPIRPPQMTGGVPPALGPGVRPPGNQMQPGSIPKAVALDPTANVGPPAAGPAPGQAVRPIASMNASLPNPSNQPNPMSNPMAAPPSTGPRPQPPAPMTATANQNPNTAAADILAKNPPPVINLNLPTNRVAPPNDNKQRPQEATPAGTPGAAPGKWAWLRACTPKPQAVKANSLTDKNIEWYLTVTEKQFATLTPEQKQTNSWIRAQVQRRQGEQYQQQQQQQQNQQQQQPTQPNQSTQPNQPNQPNQAQGPNDQQGQQGPSGSQGPGVKARQAPTPNPAPKPMTKDELAVQMSRLKDAGKHITMDSIKELCKSTNTPWTAELEKHLEQYCVPPRPIKTHRQIFTEGLHSLAIDVTGEAIDEGMEKFFMGLAEDLYSDNVRGACLAAQARNKQDTSVLVKDMAFHMRHKHDQITAGYGPEIVIAGTKRKNLLGYKPEAIKRIKDTRDAQQQ